MVLSLWCCPFGAGVRRAPLPSSSLGFHLLVFVCTLEAIERLMPLPSEHWPQGTPVQKPRTGLASLFGSTAYLQGHSTASKNTPHFHQGWEAPRLTGEQGQATLRHQQKSRTFSGPAAIAANAELRQSGRDVAGAPPGGAGDALTHLFTALMSIFGFRLR